MNQQKSSNFIVPLELIRSMILLSSLAFSTAQAGNYQNGTYEIDSMHSKVGFEISHLVISSVEGRFTNFDGKLELDPNFGKSKVSANIDVSSIDTSVPKRDDHLKSADFFDAKKHSSMTFESTEIKGTPEKFVAKGKLTIKGISKTVTLEGKYLGTVKDGYGNTKAAFEATTKFSRKDFGLTWNSVVEAGPVVGDEVEITLKIQAAKSQKAPQKQAEVKNTHNSTEGS